ncbi:MAG: c-type cytochrome [Bacteroidetes bacterium]|nr:c-type cytochrome [Bacteroidota bacterium]
MKYSTINNLFKKLAPGSKYLLTMLSMFFGLSVYAQNAATKAEEDTFAAFSNPLFIGLFSIIVLLMIVISVLAGVLKNVAYATKEKNNNGKKILSIVALIALMSSAKSVMAQEATSAVAVSGYMGLSSGLFYSLLAVIAFEILIIFVLVNSIQLMVKPEIEEMIAAKVIAAEPSLLEKLNASVSLEKEADILMDHNYDGIKELDNDLPPWWKYGFYVTIIFAFIYLVHYHVTATGDLQATEYNKSIEAAKIAKEEYAKLSANNVDETSVTMLEDKAKIAEGENIFKSTCAPCHGSLGEGNQIGPNLTDDYWLHGGSIKDIFKTIKYGYPDKGMQSWQAQYSPAEIQMLASYVKSIRGTNPPNGKEKQGDLYVEEGVAPVADSTATDSTAVAAVVDSAKVEVKK